MLLPVVWHIIVHKLAEKETNHSFEIKKNNNKSPYIFNCSLQETRINPRFV